MKLDRDGDFIIAGRLARHARQTAAQKMVTLVLKTPAAYAWGGESIVLNGETVGEISSVGWSPLAGAWAMLGYVRGAGANQAHHGTAATIELWGESVPVSRYMIAGQ